MIPIKKLIPVKIKRHFGEMYRQRLDKIELNEFTNYLNSIKLQKKIFILDACDHKNLGDQAILMAELQFLKDNFIDYQVVCVGLGKFDIYVNLVEKYVGLEDIFVLHGGGNLGNEYKRAESTRRTIIELFPNNPIILFPQTLYFTPNVEGEKELKKSIDIYSKHKNLTLVAREKTSYGLMKKYFNQNTALLTPDIVLYLNKSLTQEVRKGALFCCRNDIEGLLKEKDKKNILNFLQNNYSQVVITDTVGENSFEGVEKKFNEFKKAEIVITDRLHGMVFAAITGTPCIALSNYNYKVSGTYQWIRHFKYIKFAESIEQIPCFVAELQTLKNTKYDNQFAISYYEQIKHVMKRRNLHKNEIIQ
ncbi:polysaccharide pyruvyl transferase family protein [Bacillus rhizoplanae]|uniref:polysaccharide pyruvyl transferase family protein n=1 Tax=Bacillus rhizoplanae TaxID=2880966 RepID=UPI003D260668